MVELKQKQVEKHIFSSSLTFFWGSVLFDGAKKNKYIKEDKKNRNGKPFQTNKN